VQVPANIKTAGVIRSELSRSVTLAPMLSPKDMYVEQTLDKLFFNYDWTITFETPVAIIYDELVTSEILVILHKWLRKQCADIENIYLIVTHNAGISAWWEKWCDCFFDKSFKIVELFFNDSIMNPWNPGEDVKKYELKSLNFLKENKKILKLFSFYGGTYSTMERQYLVLKMLRFQNVAAIHFNSKFSSKKEILDYAENITYYNNQKEIDDLSECYDRCVGHKQMLPNSNLISSINYQKFLELQWSHLQWNIDKNSWATVIRETMNSDVFSTVTEKTLIACFHHTVMFPIGINSVLNLENLGFWFPHDIVDYSYQVEPIFVNRVAKMCNTLQEIINKYSMIQLEQYYFDNIQKFCYNAQLAHDYVATPSRLKKFAKYYKK
jgi:hypothetical protein